MMTTIIKTRWGTIRWIRLIFGLVLMTQVVIQFDAFLALIGGFLLYQAVFNVGCVSSACTLPQKGQTNKACKVEHTIESKTIQK